MPEFKVTSGVDAQISAFKTAGSDLNAAYSATDSAGVSTLTTATAAIAEQASIRKLLELYAGLVVKDADDLAAMAETARQLDQTVSGSIGK